MLEEYFCNFDEVEGFPNFENDLIIEHSPIKTKQTPALIKKAKTKAASKKTTSITKLVQKYSSKTKPHVALDIKRKPKQKISKIHLKNKK